jgi:hypothetical protein
LSAAAIRRIFRCLALDAVSLEVAGLLMLDASPSLSLRFPYALPAKRENCAKVAVLCR